MYFPFFCLFSVRSEESSGIIYFSEGVRSYNSDKTYVSCKILGFKFVPLQL